jgi:DNA-binding GntR family transcriptional regulator
VNGLSSREVREIYQVRRLLEVEATRLACGHHGSALLARLAALIEEMAAADPHDAAVQFDLNRQFHRTLVEPCDNHVLLKMLDTLWDHPVNRRITRSYLVEAGSSQAMIDEHRELLAAAAAGNESVLLELTSGHLMTGYDDAMHALDESNA